jgi:hypothetical protein
MFDKVLKRVTRILATLAIVTLSASAGNAADLRIPVHAQARPAGPESRDHLFQQFLKFLKERNRH